jgi:hypothetical protein
LSDVGVTCGSYAGNVMLTFAGRKGSFASREDLRRLAAYFCEEVDALYDAAVAKKRP